ncbi:hypothetical protein ACPOM7_16110 [Peribacillus castrilensis]|uniref:Uncharacterized protein n=3 Tax=Peribacillus TaxID=2675229 RepID=A0AAJ1QKA2_9BACI|nr:MULTISPECIES: hypothetical protein [Bacillaceae]MBD8135310.1 hypothetical protein [Bacillus sp. CFBP 13597]MBL3642866.1 hypothetical protein [Bacillus sp. RHFB]MBT2602194.1 hypothetical protein [Bacillus sp. ISL-53]MCD1159683.1 hypothetical protein [Peribacillus castrilensis]MCP1095776.1 hypothetical protein [Bacillaceae bacterium OS4b]MDP9742547.1 hypothetical protein [Bacillus sp. B2I3]QNK50567.1 hypothetical protein H7F28_10485 [Brevibacterium sp. PAMC23299]SSS88068.1 Uncharacterised 
MTPEQDYTAANLSPDLLNELKSFESKLGEEANKELIVIAYEKEKESLN